MPSQSVYSIELPYFGAILLGKSPLNLKSFQKPLRELYISYYQERFHDQRRIIISNCDLLIFEPNAATISKRTFIYSNFESIVDIQILKLSIVVSNTKSQQDKHIQAAFLPIGYEHQQRFHTLYSTINKSQYNILSTLTSYHPPLLLFFIRKPGAGNSCSLLDCHVFDIHRESRAFDFCNMIRKLIIQRTMSPILSSRTTLLRTKHNDKEVKKEKRIKYLESNRPMSTMEYQQINDQTLTDKQNNHTLSNVDSNDVVYLTTNTARNPLSSSSFLINNVQHPPPFHDTSKVLTMNRNIHHMSSPCSTSKQRHFIKASSLIKDESDEIFNDLLNIVAIEQIKSQVSVKRQASFDQTSYSNDSTMNKKRYFHNKKRLLKSIPTINNITHQQKLNSIIDGHLLRPQIVLNHYGDIGNYVPKFLRENITMRSSDSNENIFFRSTNGQLLNGFLKLDFLSTKSINDYNKTNNHYQSTPCLNQDQNIDSLVQQLRNNQTKPYVNIHQVNSNVSNRISSIKTNSTTDDDHRVPHILKSIEDVKTGNKVYPFTSNSHLHQHSCKSNRSSSSSKPKRVASFTVGDTELPVDYRQYLRHTDQGAYLYGEEQRQQQQLQTTLEHSLGYFP
ncbi:unnamed protein product [Rotaria sp. Silwood1]|nr:unnamed protein product [Rotaria sp. Silwood1]CAF1334815.1 unnamed protein product [Rotaria sp. Silwood1]CAF3520794.1 unnamed protein product [Rotaria sp. Silwood1]CAF3543190.1 unnamed protein product [Rotaria sp. Silwood1]CAF3583707.1 unnamed protein product [Rotaria sp. Silwood1]